jgi:lipopolysaccharide biosynthesis glycosyltransferase
MIIACAIDNNYIRHCAVMLKSLYDANPKEDISAYIIHGPIDVSEKKKLTVYLGRFLSSVSFIQIDPKTLEGFPVFGHLPLSTYYRFLIPTILPASLQKVIFLDCDLIVVDSLSGLWNMPLGNHPLAAVTDHHIKENCQRLGLSESSGYFNPGVLVINLDRWRKKNILSEGLKFAKSTKATLKHCDQDILNHIFKGDWLHLDTRWNAAPHLWGLCPVPADEAVQSAQQDISARDKPAIVHFAGSGIAKPWDYRCRHPWKKRYLELKKLTPWAGAPLESQPRSGVTALWRRIFLTLKRLVGSNS